MQETKDFERFVINFDEKNYTNKRGEIEGYIAAASNAIAYLETDYGIKLSDHQMEQIFLKAVPNPGGFIDEAYGHFETKTMRENARNELKNHINDMLGTMVNALDKVAPYISVKRGKFFIPKEADDTLIKQCEVSIDTARAQMIQMKHHKAFEVIKDLLTDANKNGGRLNFFAFFNVSLFSDISMKEIDYNAI